jgi:hypothetical protein
MFSKKQDIVGLKDQDTALRMMTVQSLDFDYLTGSVVMNTYLSTEAKEESVKNHLNDGWGEDFDLTKEDVGDLKSCLYKILKRKKNFKELTEC